ncbi:sensor histidine kinase [Arthrobacter sp.]|uniref:sensor histidine kinase n=1 Tax=Arthrobacter sp. TaxID=1667 RepID=UPI0026DF6CB7|nr:histidine kinase [Arthrobacter sp.]MDO5753531.1 histidine kinase [Arthrobacter sp.]
MNTSHAGAARTALSTAAHMAAVLSAAAVGLALVLTLSTPAELRALEMGPTPVVGLLAATVGALILAQRPHNPVAWLLLISGVTSAAYSLATAATALGLLSDPHARWLPWAAWVSTAGWVPGTVLGLVILPQLFPFGALLPGRFWRVWWFLSLALAAAVAVPVALSPASPTFPELANPWLAGGDSGGVVASVEALAQTWGQVLTVFFAVMSIGSVVNIVLRFKRSDAKERHQTVLVFATWLLLIVASSLAPSWVGAIAAVLYLGALLVAVARYRLYEIDQLVSRGAAGLVMVVLLGAAYALTAAGVGAMLHNLAGSWAAGFAATAVVVALLDPVRRLALGWINKIFARGRPSAAAVARRISAIAAESGSPRETLEHTEAVLRQSLHLPGLGLVAGLDVAGQEAEGSPASARSSNRILPLRWNGAQVGAVLVVPRRGEPRVHSADLRLLEALEPTLAVIVHDLAVTADLELSRRAELTAREEERRRIRRDLHDGLGPLLAGTAMTLQAVSGSGRDPESAKELLAQAQADLSQAVGDIRVLVDGLRPSSLDDLGLVATIQSLLPESAVSVSVTTHGNCATLPAAVEVAALRIVAEALTNVARHSGATTAVVELHGSEKRLRVTVTDRGSWVPPSSARAGVGLDSMRQRARELGGRTTITGADGAGTGTGAGTRVRAWLPLSPTPGLEQP